MANINWKRLGMTAGFLIAVGGGLYGYAAIKDFKANEGELNAFASEVQSLRIEAQQAGLWTEISTVQTAQRVHELERFSEFKAFDRIFKDNPEFAETLIYDDPLFAEQLVTLPEATDAFYYVAGLESVSFPIEWERGLLAPATDYTVVKRLISFATSSAMVALKNGDEEEAWRCLFAGVKIMSHLKDEPVSDSVSGWSSASAKILRTVYRIIESDPANTQAVEYALRLIELIGNPPAFDSFLPGDALKFFVSARNFDEYDDFEILTLKIPGDENAIVPEGKNRQAAFEAASIAFWISTIHEITGIENDVVIGIRLDELGHEWSQDERPSQFLSIAFSATYEQIGMQIARAKQMRRLVYMVCSLVSDWQTTGSFPNALIDRGDWSIDPVRESPFFYESFDGGFRLQAIGNAQAETLSLPRGDLILVVGQGYGLEFTVAN